MNDSVSVLENRKSRGFHGRMRSLLESAVLFGEFPPGQLLPSERLLAGRYGVTRSTVRRSLGKLVDSGLLTYQPRVGHCVVPVIRNNVGVKGGVIGLVWNVMPRLGGGIAEMELRLAKAGHVLMLGASGVNGHNEDETIRRMVVNGMTGLIITPARAGGQSKELELWVRHGRPVVLHGHPGRWTLPDDIVSHCNMVDADNNDGMRQLLSYVSGMGHRSAAFLSYEPLVGSERFASFEKLAPEFGVNTEKSWNIGNLEDTKEATSDVLAKLKSLGELPSVFVCNHPHTASTMIDAIKEAGLQCPDDISVVAFGYAEIEKDDNNELTYVNWSGREESSEMLRLLAQQFSGSDKGPEHVRVPMTLHKGTTVKRVKSDSV